MDISSNETGPSMPTPLLVTRGYQQEMLNESLHRNIIIALDTGSGKTHIAVLRLKHEMEKEKTKLSWFIAPTVALCAQQFSVLKSHLPVSVGLVSGANEPTQWKSLALWERVLRTHRIMVSTPQVLLDALRHGYILLARDISLLIFDEAHHAVDNHPYNRIMKEFYFDIPISQNTGGPNGVRPMVLGLTASPIYGGNVDMAFRTIEGNLDCTISAPRRHQSELAKYVHRPIFRHIVYYSTDTPFSTNLASLHAVVETIDINNDPRVIDLRNKLAKSTVGSPESDKYDQRLSKIIQGQNTFSHKGLRQFCLAAEVICQDLGAWAADWFVWKVVEHAKKATNPFNNIMASWKVSEKSYLGGILEKIHVNPVSYYPDDIVDDCTDKVKVLIDCLLLEKAESESLEEVYSGIIFVQRRDAVLALAEILKHHPYSKDVFNIGILLGTSDSSRRHSMMDITKSLVKESQEDTLADFKEGEKNLIVATAVAEEGIDIQACGSVIRWDTPQNMASWAQSRGRARKKRSTFTMMFEEGSKHQADIAKWEDIERHMRELIYDPNREMTPKEDILEDGNEEDDDRSYEIAATGAKVTLHSAISHLTHFCAVIPNSTHADNRPLFERDPPEFPEGWHSLPPGPSRQLMPFSGPYGSILTLPRALPLAERRFSVDRVYQTIISAHRHAAFKAYLELHRQGLLDDHLLPIASAIEPELKDEVKSMLADVEKREGMAKVSVAIDPWAPSDESNSWFCSLLTLEGLAPLYLFTRSETPPFDFDQGPTLYRIGCLPIRVSCFPQSRIVDQDATIALARNFTRRVFWALNAPQMDWDNLDFSYLFLPVRGPDPVWDSRRTWLENNSLNDPQSYPHCIMTKADEFGKEFGYPEDLTLVQRHIGFGRPWKFIGWKYNELTLDEELKLRERYKKFLEEVVITYPLLIVQPCPPRSNFLIPLPEGSQGQAIEPPPSFLLPSQSGIIFLSHEEAEYSFLLPSVLRFLSAMMTANSLRKSLFASSSLYDIPLSLLAVAMTAPSSGESHNYQRLETLGDAVLKFVVGVQLMAEYPLWHEGYLTRKKDHAVANVRLAKEDLKRDLYKWIIRDTMLGKKWKPRYFSPSNAHASPPRGESIQLPLSESVYLTGSPAASGDLHLMEGIEQQISRSEVNPAKPNKKAKNSQQLSTKILADVVESTIGAAYFHGGLPLGYECVKFFNLGLRWKPIPERIAQILACADSIIQDEEKPVVSFPRQLQDVELMIGYNFERQILLIEALTHASYQNNDFCTPSYERMEFLGDSILDLIVNDYLFHAAGKNYSPGHIFLRKSAMVNAHLLAYICLNTFTTVKTCMPMPNPETGVIEEIWEEQDIHLPKCLLHNSPRVLEDLVNVQSRFRKAKGEIEHALTGGTIFPWAALTRLQAPKFLSDMVESLIGAVFLDSMGQFEVVKSLLKRLGLMTILEHVVIGDVDVLHPVSRLSLWSQRNGKDIKYDTRKESGKVYCRVLVDGVELEGATVSENFRGKASQEEVKFAACEAAIKELRLRDAHVNSESTKKGRPKKMKKNKGKAKE